MAYLDTWKHIALAAVIVAGTLVKGIDVGAHAPTAHIEAEACINCLTDAPVVEAKPLKGPVYL